MKNIVKEIAMHLDWAGVGTFSEDGTSGNIYWGKMPDKPDECIGVMCTDAGLPGNEMPARVQIFARAKTTKAAFELSQKIVDELADYVGFLAGDLSDVRIDLINASTGMGADAKQRELFVSNFYVRYCGE